jgi:hypothetical protein
VTARCRVARRRLQLQGKSKEKAGGVMEGRRRGAGLEDGKVLVAMRTS